MEEKQFKALAGKLDRIIELLAQQNAKTDKIDKLVAAPKVGDSRRQLGDVALAKGLDGFG